jgi:hypothetical protein
MSVLYRLLGATFPTIPLSGEYLLYVLPLQHPTLKDSRSRIAKHAFARIMREKGDKWETVQTVLEEDLRHHRCVHLSKDRRIRKIMRQTWEDVSKVTF